MPGFLNQQLSDDPGTVGRRAEQIGDEVVAERGRDVHGVSVALPPLPENHPVGRWSIEPHPCTKGDKDRRAAGRRKSVLTDSQLPIAQFAIVVFVICSGLTVLTVAWLMRRPHRPARSRVMLGIPAAATLLFFGCNVLWPSSAREGVSAASENGLGWVGPSLFVSEAPEFSRPVEDVRSDAEHDKAGISSPGIQPSAATATDRPTGDPGPGADPTPPAHAGPHAGPPPTLDPRPTRTLLGTLGPPRMPDRRLSEATRTAPRSAHTGRS